MSAGGEEHQGLLTSSPAHVQSDEQGSDEHQVQAEKTPEDHWEDHDAMRFVYMGAWALCFSILYWTNRLFAKIGLPYDGIKQLEGFGAFDNFSRCLACAVVLGWYTRITQPERFWWLFSLRRWYFFVLLFTVSPIFSAISNIGGLHHSMRDISNWTPLMWTVSIVGVLFIFVVLFLHIICAFTRRQFSGALLYLLSRVSVIVFYCISYYCLKELRHYNLHVHHYFAAWCCAIFAEFNHPVSAALLAVMSAVYSQGIGAYTFAPLFYDPTCKIFGPTNSEFCTFVAENNFTIGFCYDPFGAAPAINCYDIIK